MNLYLFATILIFAVVALGYWRPLMVLRGLRPLWRFYGIIARDRVRAIVYIGLIAFLSTAAVSFFVRFPVPMIHDEFSHLLLADTFASGRLTNPTHPMWHHFESFHIFHTPTYTSMFPPAQGFILAVGKLAVGHAAFGLWLSSALACGACCWMFQAWLPPRWALLGAILILIRIGIASYWAQSYWGGMVPAFGGALVYGSLARLFNEKKIQNSIIMGVGLIILANSRPFEGFVLCGPLLLLLIVKLVKSSSLSRSILIKRIIVPLLSVGFLGIACVAYYNRQVSGDVFKMSYYTAREQYGSGAHPLFGAEKPVKYRHEVIRKFYEEYEPQYWLRYKSEKMSFSRLMEFWMDKLKNIWLFYIGSALTIPFMIGILFVVRKLPGPFGLEFASGLLVIGAHFLIPTVASPHYFAPITCLLMMFTIFGLRWLRLLRWNRKPIGRWGFMLVPALCVATLVIGLQQTLRAGIFKRIQLRENIVLDFQKREGKFLMFVRYQPEHNYHQEWVYNDANIDESKIAWAREISTEEDRRLIEYFKGREVWLVEPDRFPIGISRYDIPGSSE
jgi:hypothetical protein